MISMRPSSTLHLMLRSLVHKYLPLCKFLQRIEASVSIMRNLHNFVQDLSAAAAVVVAAAVAVAVAVAVVVAGAGRVPTPVPD